MTFWKMRPAVTLTKGSEKMFERSKLNFLVDALMFICMAALAGIGLLMKYVLLSGQGIWAEYGEMVDLYFFGLDRHEWGDIHLYIAFILTGLLALHIILHWKMIPGLYRKLIGAQKIRQITALVFLVTCTLLLALPFILDPEVKEHEGRGRNRVEASPIKGIEGKSNDHQAESAKDMGIKTGDHQAVSTKGTEGESEDHQRGSGKYMGKEAGDHQVKKTRDDSGGEHSHAESSIEVRGFMTLNDVAIEHEVPASHLKEKLGIPVSVSGNERLGSLKKIYEFRMSNVKEIIEKYK